MYFVRCLLYLYYMVMCSQEFAYSPIPAHCHLDISCKCNWLLQPSIAMRSLSRWMPSKYPSSFQSIVVDDAACCGQSIWHTTLNHFTAIFPKLPGLASARRKLLLDFMVQGKITEADTPTIWMVATPSGLTSDPPPSSPIFTPDALPVVTLPLYPGLGQAPNMLTCIPSGLLFSTIIVMYFFLEHFLWRLSSSPDIILVPVEKVLWWFP